MVDPPVFVKEVVKTSDTVDSVEAVDPSPLVVLVESKFPATGITGVEISRDVSATIAVLPGWPVVSKKAEVGLPTVVEGVELVIAAIVASDVPAMADAIEEESLVVNSLVLKVNEFVVFEITGGGEVLEVDVPTALDTAMEATDLLVESLDSSDVVNPALAEADELVVADFVVTG